MARKIDNSKKIWSKLRKPKYPSYDVRRVSRGYYTYDLHHGPGDSEPSVGEVHGTEREAHRRAKKALKNPREETINELSPATIDSYADKAWSQIKDDKNVKKRGPGFVKAIKRKFDGYAGYKPWKGPLSEGAAASRFSKHVVTCPVCEGKKKDKPCKRCEGTGKLAGRPGNRMNKPNTGVHSRIAWIKGEETINEVDQAHQETLYRNMGYWDGKSDRETKASPTQTRWAKAYVYRAMEPFKRAYWDGYWAGYYDRMFNPLSEDAPTNSMGMSSSTPSTGAIDTFDPLLKLNTKTKLKKLLGRKKPF